MLCAALVDEIGGGQRRCAREGVRQIGPLGLCWQHAQEAEVYFRHSLGFHDLEREIARLKDQMYALRMALADRRMQIIYDTPRIELEGSCVYLARIPRCPGLLKVGFTTNLRNRMAALSGAAIDARPGTKDDEKAMHRRLADLGVGGEWFLDVPDLIERFKAA